MLSKRLFFYSVKLPKTVEFSVLRAKGLLYVSGLGGVKSMELFDCFYKSKVTTVDMVLSFKFFNSSLFSGVFVALGVICRDLYWGFFFELYVYGPGFLMSWWGKEPCQVIEFSMGLTHAIYLLCQSSGSEGSGRVMARGDRESILFFAVEKRVLYDVVACVVLLKRMNPYKMMGVVYPHQLISAKKAVKKTPVL